MGRRKFDIGLIQNERCRQVTFSKRKLGVIRKATELSVLCNSDVAVIIFGGKNKLSIYSSRPINTLVSRFFENQHKAEVVTTEDYFRKRARRAAMGGHSDNEDAVGPGSGGAWPITHRTDNMAALQPYQAQGQAYPQPQQAYGINPYSPNMHPLQGAPVGQTMQAMQDMRLQLQQQQQLLHQQQLQHMQEQIQQQQEMLKRFTQMQHPPLDLADPAQDRFQPQAVQAQLAQQQPVAQPLTMQDQPQLLQPQCGFQSQAFSSYGGATQAMPPQPDPAPSTQNLQAQLQQLQEQQSLVQQQLDTLQRPS